MNLSLLVLRLFKELAMMTTTTTWTMLFIPMALMMPMMTTMTTHAVNQGLLITAIAWCKMVNVLIRTCSVYHACDGHCCQSHQQSLHPVCRSNEIMSLIYYGEN
jgi:hypothetical protein